MFLNTLGVHVYKLKCMLHQERTSSFILLLIYFRFKSRLKWPLKLQWVWP